jgi:hypothetical protein
MCGIGLLRSDEVQGAQVVDRLFEAAAAKANEALAPGAS